jgi:hypothetical protein
MGLFYDAPELDPGNQVEEVAMAVLEGEGLGTLKETVPGRLFLMLRGELPSRPHGNERLRRGDGLDDLGSHGNGPPSDDAPVAPDLHAVRGLIALAEILHKVGARAARAPSKVALRSRLQVIGIGHARDAVPLEGEPPPEL